jgi:methionyl-tRNA synthetase
MEDPVNRFISTAIAYVNAEPHLGHALELVITDALARSYRARGDDVLLVTGTDENSAKNVRAAAVRGCSTRALVDENAALFRKLTDRIGLSYDRFVRTSADADHAEVVANLWRSAAGDLYRGVYRGLYCVGCEAFLGERDLIDGACPEHGVPERIEEENVFFRLSKYTREIRARIESGELEIVPRRVREEVLGALDEGLPDLSVSRPSSRVGGWGIAVPGDPSQVIYVWYDALASYLTGAGDRWESSHRTHVIGKGIAKFHAIYWPAFLLSAGVPLPHRIAVHGYLTVDGRKIGKSLGNAIDPNAVIDRYGLDAVRWYLLRQIRTTEDGDFSRSRFEEVYQSELAHGIGNLVGRVIGLREKLGIDPVPAADRSRLVRDAVDRFELDAAAAAIAAEVTRVNAFLQERAPWKQGVLHSDAIAVVREAIAAVAAISQDLAPFLPDTARAIDARLTSRGPAAPLFEDLRSRSKGT